MPMKKYVAELIGTMVLVLLGCGSAVFAGGVADTVGAGVGGHGIRSFCHRHGIYHRKHFRLSHQSGHHTGCMAVGRYENETGIDVHAVSGCGRHYRFADSHAAGIDRCTRRADDHRLQQLCI